MRLLNTKTLELTYFVGDAPEYAILSHRWEKEEILFEDVSKTPLSSPDNPARSKLGFAKVIGTCALAANDGFEWVWIDSCCIDKSSSAELQESINSMFRWYRKAQVCYAYLSDVADELSGWSKDFEESQWFTRGWTLQELLAPSNVEFYSANWSPIGTKLCRTELIASITGIETEALEFEWGSKDDMFCAAQKFSWAAHRRVSKAEDTAYCLFGLFNVNMPLLYGEGEERAFQRLQKVIFKETADHTLFLFAWSLYRSNAPMLANWTSRFCRRSNCFVCRSHRVCFPSDILYSEVIRSPVLSQLSAEDAHYIRLVKQGVILKLPLLKYNNLSAFCIGARRRDFQDKSIAILLPWCRRGRGDSLFGIVLQQISDYGYVRSCTEPVLLNPVAMDLGSRPSAYTVYNELAEDPSVRLDPPFCFSAPVMKIAHFQFSSQSFKPFDWRCEIQYEVLVQTKARASFPCPEQQNDRSFIIMSFQDMVDQDMVGTIRLWYSMSKIGLYEITLSQGRRRLGRWRVDYTYQSRQYMSIVMPFGQNGHGLRVVLRRTSIPKYMWSRVVGDELLAFFNRGLDDPTATGRPYEIQAGYRLHVTHVPNGSQPSTSESGTA